VELILMCLACADDRELLRVGMDTFEGCRREIDWIVPPAAEHRVRLDGPAGDRLYVQCERGHDLQRRTAGLEEQLNMMWQPLRHATEVLWI
jgi:hypothetical protein